MTVSCVSPPAGGLPLPAGLAGNNRGAVEDCRRVNWPDSLPPNPLGAPSIASSSSYPRCRGVPTCQRQGSKRRQPSRTWCESIDRPAGARKQPKFYDGATRRAASDFRQRLGEGGTVGSAGPRRRATIFRAHCIYATKTRVPELAVVSATTEMYTANMADLGLGSETSAQGV